MSLDEEQAAIQRRQRIAEALMQQGQMPLETNQVAGGYVVPVSPLAGVAKVAQSLAGAYMNKQADQEQSSLRDKKLAKLVEATQGGNLDYGKLAESGVDTGSIAKIIVDRQSKANDLENKLNEKKLELSLPTNDMRNATWAANGDEARARDIIANKLQNPIPMLSYQLQANNAAANQDIQKQQLDIRRQEIAQKSGPSEWQQFQIQQQEDKKALADAEKQKLIKNQSLDAQKVLDQAEKLYNHPGRKIGTGASSWTGIIPGTEAKGFQANLDTFKAETFVPMVSALKGMGALSDAEGKKLTESVGALNPAMPEKDFENSLKEITNYLYRKAAINGLNVSLPSFAGNNVNIDIQHPENLTEEDKAKIESELSKDQGLSPQEQQELEALRARFGKK